MEVKRVIAYEMFRKLEKNKIEPCIKLKPNSVIKRLFGKMFLCL